MFFALDAAGGEDETNCVAHRFISFTMKILNEDMDPLFEKWVPVFDQSLQEVQQQGETHEQYAAYKEYAEALEEHVARFAEQEGYSPGDGGNFLAALQTALDEDRARAEKQVEAFLEQMRQQRRQLTGSDQEADPEELAMLKMLFKPQTADDMLQMILHMTEYRSFSNLMRSKVQQQKFIREMERKKKEMLEGEMGLAHRFIQFGMKLLNNDMDDFYSKSLSLFDQDAQNYEQQGQTHEQYNAFLEYIGTIESALQDFAVKEGFGQDAQGMLVELQRLVQKDQEEVDRKLQESLKQLEQKKEELRARYAETGEQGCEPMILICKPSSMGDLINAMIRQTEYQTFSATMRFRVEQNRIMKELFGPRPTTQAGTQESLSVEDVEGDVAARPTLGTVSVTVPEGAEAGSVLNVDAPDGQSLQVTVPGGLTPGMAFDAPFKATGGYGGNGGYGAGGAVPVAPAPAAKLAVTVPEGCEPGSQLSVTAPDGQSLVVTIPEGSAPGTTFETEYYPQS
eukprot:TRINITY_DN17041_c0_g1_i1.p1 TRINITY_DN17041_c0_g1~~TRINITY_DN17041_c0_g1_i1.p1  ORF type:complete len:532 (-),score=123.75 TRINITY_DN17041_c0_g1_i1:360-1889(-)